MRNTPNEFEVVCSCRDSRVAIHFCPRGEKVSRCLGGNTRASRATSIASEDGHRGLCGKHQPHVIAGIMTNDLLAASGAPLANEYRKQVRRCESTSIICGMNGLFRYVIL